MTISQGTAATLFNPAATLFTDLINYPVGSFDTRNKPNCLFFRLYFSVLMATGRSKLLIVESALDSIVLYSNRCAYCQSAQKMTKEKRKKRKVENGKKHKPNENGKGKNVKKLGTAK